MKSQRENKRAPSRGAARDKSVIARSFGASFRMRPQELAPYRGCQNHQFNWWFLFHLDESGMVDDALKVIERAIFLLEGI